MKRNIGIVVDWETSGIRQQEVPWLNYLEGPQGIEIGAVVIDLPNFEPIAEFTSRVRFIGKAQGIAHSGPQYEGLSWSTEAETIHGIKIADLKDAPNHRDVAQKFVNFVKTSADIKDPQKQPIMICGHNPAGDAYYTRQLLFLGGCEHDLRFHYRMLDSFTLGYVTYGTKSSNDLFCQTSGGYQRSIHHALEDAKLTLKAFQTINQLHRG